jgi:hypothetical protein
MAYVYRHIRLDKNQPFYIGIGSDENYWRATKKSQRNKYWKNIVNKTQYQVEIIFDNLTWGEAQKKEIEFIKLYGRQDLGTGTLVNMTDGGEGNLGAIVSDEKRKKISLAVKGFKHSEETKLKMSKSKKGKKHSEETKRKIALSKENISEETRKKLSLKSKGKIISKEQRENISKLMTGRKVIISEEHKIKLSIALKNYHLKLKENGNI